MLTSFGCQFVCVQSLAKYFHSQFECIGQLGLSHFVLLFQHGNSGLIIVANTSRFPATVIARRITLVQLVAEMLVPAHVQNGHAERSFTTELSVGLLDVAQLSN